MITKFNAFISKRGLLGILTQSIYLPEADLAWDYMKLEDILLNSAEYAYNKEMTVFENLWAYAKIVGKETEWQEMVKIFQENDTMPTVSEVEVFENLIVDIDVRFQNMEKKWGAEVHEHYHQVFREAHIEWIVKSGKLPKIVDIMLKHATEKLELVKPEYVALTPTILKKWWAHKDEPQRYEYNGYRDLADLFQSTCKQDSAERIWGICRCFPCSLALNLIRDIRRGINVYNPSSEELKESSVMYLAGEYGGNWDYKSQL